MFFARIVTFPPFPRVHLRIDSFFVGFALSRYRLLALLMFTLSSISSDVYPRLLFALSNCASSRSFIDSPSLSPSQSVIDLGGILLDSLGKYFELQFIPAHNHSCGVGASSPDQFPDSRFGSLFATFWGHSDAVALWRIPLLLKMRTLLFACVCGAKFIDFALYRALISRRVRLSLRIANIGITELCRIVIFARLLDGRPMNVCGRDCWVS